MSNTNDPPAVPPVPRGSFEAIRESYQKKNGAILLRPGDVQAKLPLPTLHKFINDNPTPRDHKALDGYFGDELKTLAHNFFNCGDTTDYQHVVAYLKAKGDLFEVNVVYLLNCLEIEKKKTKDLVEKQISTLEELETRNKRTSAELKTGLANIRAAKKEPLLPELVTSDDTASDVEEDRADRLTLTRSSILASKCAMNVGYCQA